MIEVPDGEATPTGYLRVLAGSSIGRDGAIAFVPYCISGAAVAEGEDLRAGDVVIARVSRLPLRVAEISDAHMPAVAANSLVRVRFAEDLVGARRALLVAYLRCARFGAAIAERSSVLSGSVAVTLRALLEAPVPRFDEALVEAMSRLSSAEAGFLRLAAQASSAGRTLLEAESYSPLQNIG